MTDTQFTDRQFAALFYGLSQDYKSEISNQRNPHQIANSLKLRVEKELFDENSTLYKLTLPEKNKVRKAVSTILDLLLKASAAPRVNLSHQNQPKIVLIQNRHYCYHDNLMWDFFLWDYSWRARAPWYYGYNGGYHNYGYHHHGHTHGHHGVSYSSGSSDDPLKVFLAILAMIALMILTGLVIIAMGYLFSEIKNNIERLYYDEGMLQAGLSLMTMAAISVTISMITSFFLAAPLITALCVGTALSSPVGLAIFALMGITIVTTALTYTVAQKLLNYGLKTLETDTLDPDDPFRYKLTPFEVRRLEQQHIDPVKVKCAILALRTQIDDRNATPEFSLFYSRSHEEQQALTQIRKLRKGYIAEATINMEGLGRVKFDCKLPIYSNLNPENYSSPQASAW